ACGGGRRGGGRGGGEGGVWPGASPPACLARAGAGEAGGSADHAGRRQAAFYAFARQRFRGARRRRARCPATKARGERLGFGRSPKRQKDQHLISVIAARKVRGFKTVLIQPNPHRTHAAQELVSAQTDLDVHIEYAAC